eukprot:CAMPEP_0184493412 /NCGR_PEP_ID=MMETSP0113_2-20130426/25937_1 /TAXON_ID=91329 /ORGANISM="Norrisiella sphaerica, Strain BC52" /LENGTH=83 /DNA_ID=CAMNT_0026878657 /DNA_START=88 /DNA_END=336 /DNA_ORIENTATION=+
MADYKHGSSVENYQREDEDEYAPLDGRNTNEGSDEKILGEKSKTDVIKDAKESMEMKEMSKKSSQKKSSAAPKKSKSKSKSKS